MPNWVYEARDKSGKPVRGSRQAPDRQTVLEALRAEGLFLTRLEAGKGGGRSAPVKPAVAAATGTPPAPLRPASAVPAAPGGPAASATAETTRINPQSPSQAPARGVSLGGNIPADGSAAPEPPPVVPSIYVRTSTVGQSASAPIPPRPFMRAGSKELALYFSQLGAMVHAGTSIGHALATMSGSAGSQTLRQVSKEMYERVMAGAPVSECMTAYPGVFSTLQIGMISAGERGGFLDRMLNRLATYSGRDYELQSMIKRETWYPKLLVFCAILIPSAVPLVLGLVQGRGLGGALLAWLAVVAPPFMVIFVLFIAIRAMNRAAPLLLNGGSPRELWDKFKLNVPIGGKVTRGLATAKFCRAMGALYSAGVGPTESVRLASSACGNSIVASRALAIIPNLERGEKLTQCLASTHYFPPIALQMMRTGEETGMLDEQLEKAADFMEQDCETAIRQSVQVLGILAFLGVAIYIGMTVIHFYTGYFDAMLKEGGP